ncbi:hypothetical protein NI17_019000 [Thermobifida halotolerans]|uniref:Uncharacterized protein n=1 Tax=Thermobifida halotolerans TaxID=483545 RepID=A0A399FX39_9ACTN|nr:hypothetical protein [Thermobifida halotolerans]UOE18841.1 hypothetical protein NI17_019000 [Thermobifida halotolerans]
MAEASERETERQRDRFFAPVVRADDEPQASDRARARGYKVTGTGVPTRVPAEDGDTEARSGLEGPPDNDFAPDRGEDQERR